MKPLSKSQHITVNVNMHTCASCNISRVGHQLGQGHFGVVDRGIWNDSSGMIFEVALKSANPGASIQERIKLLQEAAIMAQFRHPNVLQIYGAVVQPGLVNMAAKSCFMSIQFICEFWLFGR